MVKEAAPSWKQRVKDAVPPSMKRLIRPEVEDNAHTKAVFDALRENQLYPAIIADNLGKVLHDGPPRRSVAEALLVKQKVGANISYGKARHHSPEWMDVNGVYRMASELTASPFWQLVFQEADDVIQATPNAGYIRADYRRAAEAISVSNADTMTSAVVGGLLAAAIGSGAEQILQPEGRLIRTGFVAEIGASVGSPARNVDEFMNRIEKLIPDPAAPDPGDADLTLNSALQRSLTFTTPKARKVPVTGRYCAAVDFTATMFDEWGRLLATPAYEARFRRTVAKSRARRLRR
jgi:hypothetical protein